MSHKEKEHRTLLVIVLTAFTMVIELVAGTLTHSMALLADGWHMLSHTGALLVAYFAYRMVRWKRFSHLSDGARDRFIPLGGYTNAILLAVVAVLMVVESVTRFLKPEAIYFNEAILVAILGLIVNLVSAYILGSTPKGHGHSHDTNLRGAYFHVLADALTSILAVVALSFGKLFQMNWMDPMMGLVGSAVILRWSYNLCRDSGWQLILGDSAKQS